MATPHAVGLVASVLYRDSTMKLIPLDAANIATVILSSDYLVTKHREVLDLWCGWRGIQKQPETSLLQPSRYLTTSDYWLNEQDAALAANPEVEAQVAELSQWFEDGLIPEEDFYLRCDVLMEPLLPTVLDDVRMWLPRHSCYTSALWERDVAMAVYPDRQWKLVIAQDDLHGFVYSEDTDEIFDLLLTELSGKHHTLAKVFDDPADYVQYLNDMEAVA